jgi:acetamidase/formamidase
MAVHTLVVDEATAHTFFSRDLESVLTIDLGEAVSVGTLDMGGGLGPRRLDGGERRKLKLARKGPGGHSLVGPIAVRGVRALLPDGPRLPRAAA